MVGILWNSIKLNPEWIKNTDFIFKVISVNSPNFYYEIDRNLMKDYI